jgi:hypothetical protein
VARLQDGLVGASVALRSRLDAHATRVALACGAAVSEPSPRERRARYRQARPLAAECLTLLDIIAAQARGAGGPAAAAASGPVAAQAQALAVQIVAQLFDLTTREP